MTSLENKINVLAELWLDYREDENLQDFLEYNDIGLPLAYFISSQIVEISPRSEIYIDETFHLLLKSLELEDTGFNNLTEVLTAGIKE
jgi:hypothetical protein